MKIALKDARFRLNGAFRGQQVTGQQRYAAEIARKIDIKERRSPNFMRDSRILSWLWAQILAVRTRDRLLLTLTSRGPIWSRNQVVVVHDLFVFDHPEWYSTIYVWTHRLTQRLQMISAAGLVAVSQTTADALIKRYPKKRVVVAPNAPSQVFLDAEPNSDLRKWGLEAGSYILTVGSLEPRKNLQRLVEAHRSLESEWRHRFPLVLVGRTDVKVFAAKEEDIIQDGSILQLGYVSDGDLAALYASAGCVAFIPLDEGFGLPAVEAIAAGAQVVASDIPILRWVLGTAAIFVQPHDVGAIARGLVEGTDGGEAPKRVDASRFEWGQSAEIIQDFMRDLALGRRGRNIHE